MTNNSLTNNSMYVIVNFLCSSEVVCVRIAQCRPHQQPITEMHSEGGRILTGGQDHVLKVLEKGIFFLPNNI